MTDVIIRNIGRIVSGDLAHPFVEGDTLVVRDGKIAQAGSWTAVSSQGIDHIVDAGGCIVAPGLIDSHTHPVLGDFTPRQRMIDFIESCLHGGVTRMISAGEVHTPGRPKDALGTKSLAILASKAFRNIRPGGVKVLGGSVLLEPGLTERDFEDMAAAGIKIVGEIGVSGVYKPEEAAPMTRWAQKHGMKVMIHMGGASVPGSNAIDAQIALAIRPDVAVHINGGPTAPSLPDIERLIVESDMSLEIVQCGNIAIIPGIMGLIIKHNALGRLIIGTDMPSGTGVIPLGILRTISNVSALGNLAPEQAIALATGNTARVYGLPAGRIEVGLEADLNILDAPRGSQAKDALEALRIGDTPAVAAAFVDGEVKVFPSRNTPPPQRKIQIPWMQAGRH